jgi:hypothetical protein
MACSDRNLSIEVTLAAVKKVISEEELRQAARGATAPNDLEITPSDFIISGIELEDHQ